MTFHDVSKMLEYFRKNPISYEINGIGEPCLSKGMTFHDASDNLIDLIA